MAVIDFALMLLFYLVIIPASILIHELSHGAAALILTKDKIRIYLGPVNEGKASFRIGRVLIFIKPAYTGRFVFNTLKWMDLSKFQRIVIAAAGPMGSILLSCLLSTIWMNMDSANVLHDLIAAVVIYNLLVFIATMIPLKYPRWWMDYGGMYSDGYRIMQAMKK